jgi:hypothetical protein
LDILKMMAAREQTTQKAIVVEALTAYFSQKQENLALLMPADKAFAEWDNEEPDLDGVSSEGPSRALCRSNGDELLGRGGIPRRRAVW